MKGEEITLNKMTLKKVAYLVYLTIHTGNTIQQEKVNTLNKKID